MIVPAFDRWRARLITHTDGDALGTMDAIQVAPVTPSVALVCPFERFDGDPCEQLITYYLKTAEGHALGACHRHLAHALDILVTAGKAELADPADDSLLAPPEAGVPSRAPVSRGDERLAQVLIAAGICAAVDFGSTSVHEGYGRIVGADVVLTPAAAAAPLGAELVRIATDFGVEVAPLPDGALRFTTPMPELSEEWICENAALREMLRDAFEHNLDHTGYRYRAIADELPERVAFEPRVYSHRQRGEVEVRFTMLATTLDHGEAPAQRSLDRRSATLALDGIPRPGDYVELPFARYRIVAVDADGARPYVTADAVLDRVHRPSRN